jgi:hypothetical protein
MRSASCSLRLAEDGGREAADAVGGAGQLGHGGHAADDDWRPGGAEVGAQYDVGIEDSDVAMSLQARGNL